MIMILLEVARAGGGKDFWIFTDGEEKSFFRQLLRHNYSRVSRKGLDYRTKHYIINDVFD